MDYAPVALMKRAADDCVLVLGISDPNPLVARGNETRVGDSKKVKIPRISVFVKGKIL